jgi:hypothetical protein
MKNQMRKSENHTFKDEFNFLFHNVPDALYGNNKDFWGYEEYSSDDPDDLGNRIRKFLKDILSTTGSLTDKPSPTTTPLGEFETVKELIEAIVKIVLQSKSSVGASDLIAQFGRDCLGCYLPMHAFYQSRKTPWGIYLFPRVIRATSEWLHSNLNDKFPNMTLEDFVRVTVYGTYRHEVFHYQTEKYATNLEILTIKPIYKPYNERVEQHVRNTEFWLEEALAEAVSHSSRYITNSTKYNIDFVKTTLKYFSDNSPPGYKDYACSHYKGKSNAFKYFSSQIAYTELSPKLIATQSSCIQTEFIDNGEKVPFYIYDNIGFAKGHSPEDAIIK